MIKIRDDFTERLLVSSGIKQGMRVLDVGCGRGDVSVIAARLVGDSGEVLGFDISLPALTAAKSFAAENHAQNITFIQADISQLPADIGKFDAIIGRRVLMYLPDALSAINNLKPFLQSGGIFVFQESDCMLSELDKESLPLHSMVQQWIWQTVEKEGGNLHIGRELYSLFKKAGFKIEDIKAEAVLHTIETGSDLAMVTGMMLERITSHNVASLAEIDIDSLAARLAQELLEKDTVLLRDIAFGICARQA